MAAVLALVTDLAAGVILDATVIQGGLILPAVISLMGQWNWWLPSWPARLLRVDHRSRAARPTPRRNSSSGPRAGPPAQGPSAAGRTRP
jgi:RND superfamily putative drug exporter